MDDLNLFIPIKKVDVAQRLVYGQLAAEVPDHSGEIMDYETSAPNFKLWSDEISKVTDGKSAGNVRAMHTSIAAGKLTDISFDDATKSINGCAKIIDDNEWKKVLEGVYTGFSMGGKYVKRWTDPSNPALKRYTASVHEVSIVDLPCIPTAKFEVIKADGSSEMRKFKVIADADADLKQVWLAKDGSTHEKKADALQKNVDLAVAAVPDAVTNAMNALQKAQAALATKEGNSEVPAVAPVAEAAVEKTVQAEPAKTEDGKVITEADARVAVIKAAADNLGKGLCDVANLIEVINALTWLQSDLAWHALFNESESTLPQDCKAVLAQMCELLTAMVAEATAAITADKAAGLTLQHVESLRKFSGNAELLKDFAEPATTPTVDEATITKMQADHAEALKKVSDDLEIEKAAKIQYQATVETLTKGVDDMAARIAKLEAQPLPAKGHKSVTVLKGHEGQASGADDVSDEALITKFAHLPPEQARAKFAEAKAKLGR